MAYWHNRGRSKVDPCVALCNTFNNLKLKTPSRRSCYEDYVRKQLLLLEDDEDDPSKLYEAADMLRRYIEDVPKPFEETIEFVKDVHKKIFFLSGIASRDITDSRKFPNSPQLHFLLVRYVELEYEVLYSTEDPSPEYEKEVEERVLSLLLTILQESGNWKNRDTLDEGIIDETCAMNTLHIMKRVREDYKKKGNFIEEIMNKLLKILDVLTNTSEMTNKNGTYLADKLRQVPKVQKIIEYMRHRDCELDPDVSEDEIEEMEEDVVEQVATPVKEEIPDYNDVEEEEEDDELEEKYNVTSFACYGTEKKVMTIDLIDEDVSMVYYRPEVQKLDRKSVFTGYNNNVQISERILSNISDNFDRYIQLNNVTTSTTCDNKQWSTRTAICNNGNSVFLIDDSDSDIEIIEDSNSSVVNLESDSTISSSHLENPSKPIEIREHLQSATNSELEDALLQCDDISDNEIENEDDILNKFDDDLIKKSSITNEEQKLVENQFQNSHNDRLKENSSNNDLTATSQTNAEKNAKEIMEKCITEHHNVSISPEKDQVQKDKFSIEDAQIFEASAQTVSVTTANSSFVVATEESFINGNVSKHHPALASEYCNDHIAEECVKNTTVIEEEAKEDEVVNDISCNTQPETIEEIKEMPRNDQEALGGEECLLPSEDHEEEPKKVEITKENKNDSLNTEKDCALTTNKCNTSPTVSYDNQTSCEDLEEYGEFNAAFPDHDCSNNLDVLASVAAEQEKMENSIEMRRKGYKKKGRKMIKSKIIEKPKKKRKSDLPEPSNNQITRRITRSSTAQLNYTTETPQDHSKCIPSTFMNLENLVTPTPNRIYNLIPETVIENEESLDEPFTCLVSCENRDEIVTKNPVFDEDTIEDGITLISHKKQQNNNHEVVISIPDSEKDFPGINYDILEQAEKFVDTNIVITEGFYRNSEIETDDVGKNRIWKEIIVDTTKVHVDGDKVEGKDSKALEEIDSELIHKDSEVEVSTSVDGDAIRQGRDNADEEENNSKEVADLPPKRNRRKASLNKTPTLIMPVKKRQNYGKKNIIINKYETKNIDPDEASNTEIESVEPVKQVEEATMDETTTNKQNHEESEVVVSSESTLEAYSVANANKNHLIEEINIPESDSDKITKENLLKKSETLQEDSINACRTESPAMEAPAFTMEEEISSSETSSATVEDVTEPQTQECVSESEELTINNINSSEPKSTVECVTNLATMEDVADSTTDECVTELATMECVTESAELSVEKINFCHAESSTVECGTEPSTVECGTESTTPEEESPKLALQEEMIASDVKSSTLECVRETQPCIHEEEVAKTKPATVDHVTEPLEEEINSSGVITTTTVHGDRETALEEVITAVAPEQTVGDKEEIHTIDYIVEAPELTVETAPLVKNRDETELEAQQLQDLIINKEGNTINVEEEMQTHEVPVIEESVHEEVVSTEIEISQCVSSEILVESDKTCDEDNKLSRTPPVLEKILESHNSIQKITKEGLENNQDARTMPTLEREISLNQNVEKEMFLDDNYPLLAGYEIEAFTEEVVESSPSEVDTEKILQAQEIEENISLESVKSVEISKEMQQTNKVTAKITEEPESLKLEPGNDGNRRVLTKAALKAFQNPYVQLQKLPDNYDYYKRNLNEAKPEKIGEQRSKSQDNTFKLHKRDNRSLSESKHKKTYEPTKKDKRVTHKERDSKREEREEHKKKEESSKAKTRSSSQKQREKEVKAIEKYKTRSLSETKPKQNDEKKLTQIKENFRIGKELQLFSVEDSKITYYDRRKKPETPKREQEKRSDSVETNSNKKEEKSCLSEEIINKDSGSRSSSRNERKSSKHNRDKSEKEEIETQNKHGGSGTIEETHKTKTDSPRRHSRRSISISSTTDTTREEKSKKNNEEGDKNPEALIDVKKSSDHKRHRSSGSSSKNSDIAKSDHKDPEEATHEKKKPRIEKNKENVCLSKSENDNTKKSEIVSENNSLDAKDTENVEPIAASRRERRSSLRSNSKTKNKSSLKENCSLSESDLSKTEILPLDLSAKLQEELRKENKKLPKKRKLLIDHHTCEDEQKLTYKKLILENKHLDVNNFKSVIDSEVITMEFETEEIVDNIENKIEEKFNSIIFDCESQIEENSVDKEMIRTSRRKKDHSKSVLMATENCSERIETQNEEPKREDVKKKKEKVLIATEKDKSEELRKKEEKVSTITENCKEKVESAIENEDLNREDLKKKKEENESKKSQSVLIPTENCSEKIEGNDELKGEKLKKKHKDAKKGGNNIKNLENCISIGAEKIENLLQDQEHKSEDLKKKKSKKNAEKFNLMQEKISDLTHEEPQKLPESSKKILNQNEEPILESRKKKESKKVLELPVTDKEIESLTQIKTKNENSKKNKKENLSDTAILTTSEPVPIQNEEPMVLQPRKKKESKKLVELSETDTEIENLIQGKSKHEDSKKKKEENLTETCISTASVEIPIQNEEPKVLEPKKKKVSAKIVELSKPDKEIEDFIQTNSKNEDSKKKKKEIPAETSISTASVEIPIHSEELVVHRNKKEHKNSVELSETAAEREDLLQKQLKIEHSKKEKENLAENCNSKANKEPKSENARKSDKTEELLAVEPGKNENLKENKSMVEDLRKKKKKRLENCASNDVEPILTENQAPKSENNSSESKKNEDLFPADAKNIENLIQKSTVEDLRKKKGKLPIIVGEPILGQNEEPKSEESRKRSGSKKDHNDYLEKIENVIEKQPKVRDSKKKKAKFLEICTSTVDEPILIQNEEPKSKNSRKRSESKKEQENYLSVVEKQPEIEDSRKEMEKEEEANKCEANTKITVELPETPDLIQQQESKSEDSKKPKELEDPISIKEIEDTTSLNRQSIAHTNELVHPLSNNHPTSELEIKDTENFYSEMVINTDNSKLLVNGDLVDNVEKKKKMVNKKLDSTENSVSVSVISEVVPATPIINDGLSDPSSCQAENKAKNVRDIVVEAETNELLINESLLEISSQKEGNLESKLDNVGKDIEILNPVEKFEPKDKKFKKSAIPNIVKISIKKNLKAEKRQPKKKDPKRIDFIIEHLKNINSKKQKEVTDLVYPEVLEVVEKTNKSENNSLLEVFPGEETHSDLNHEEAVDYTIPVADQSEPMDLTGSIMKCKETSKPSRDLQQVVEINNVEVANIEEAESEKETRRLEETQIMEEDDSAIIPSSVCEINDTIVENSLVEEQLTRIKAPEIVFTDTLPNEILEEPKFNKEHTKKIVIADSPVVEKPSDDQIPVNINKPLPELSYPNQKPIETSLNNHEVVKNVNEDLIDIRPRSPVELINDDSLIEISDSDSVFMEKLKVPSLPNDILHFKDHSKNNNNNNNAIPITRNNTVIQDHAVPSTSSHIHNYTVPGVSQVLDIDKQPEEVIVSSSTPTSCETTDNLIAVIFSNAALCNTTEVINDSGRNQPNKTGFIYFRGTDHNYHSVGDPLLSGKCDNNESDHSSENSKEVPTPELENVLVDDTILPYIPTLTENNLTQELSESPVDSSTDFQLLEQSLIARESSPPLPQGCENLYQTNLKQEVLDYDDNSSSNMEFTQQSEVYINQFQQQTMSVENMSELMNAVLTRIQNLNNMTRPAQCYETAKENVFQPVQPVSEVQTTNTNFVVSDCNFVPMQQESYPESTIEYSNISFNNEVTEPVSFETDFTNFYYLPVTTHDTSLKKNCNKKVIVERIPQYSEQVKGFTEITNIPSVSAAPTPTNRPVKPIKQPELPKTTKEITKPPNVLKQSEVIDPVPTTINVGFVRTSSRTRVSAPRPKKPSDRKSYDANEESGAETDRSFNKSDTNRVLKLKVRADLGMTLDTTQEHKIAPSKERSMCIIDDSKIEDKFDIKKAGNKPTKEKQHTNIEDLNKINVKTQTKPKEDDDNALKTHKIPKHGDNTKPNLTLTVKDAKSQTNDLIMVQDKPKHSQSNHSDMIDNVKRRKRKPVDYIERVDYSSIDKLLGYELLQGKLPPQRTRQKKEESEEVPPRPKKRKETPDDKPKLNTTCKPLQESDKDALSVCSISDTELDVIANPKTTSIFDDSDDDIPLKRKSKPLEPDSMNDLFDRLVKEGNINTITNTPKHNKNDLNETFSKNLLDPSRTIANNIFNLEPKKTDAITPVKQIGVVNPIRRSSNVVRKEPNRTEPSRNSYGGIEENRNSSQYYPYYSDRSRRSYPYSNRESSRSSHQGNSRRMEYQPHSSDQRYSSSQRSSSSARSSRSSRHHSNSRSSTEQRNYNRYASSAANDLAWREDMKKKFPNMFKDEVYF